MKRISQSTAARAYAQVLISQGVNLFYGQKLHISSPHEYHDFCLLLTEAAYRGGASYVEVNLKSNSLLRSRVDYSQEARFLDEAPSYMSSHFNQMVAEDWAFLFLESNEDNDIFQDADTARLSRARKAERLKKDTFYHAIQKDGLAWCVAAVPGPRWARQVLGEELSPLATDEEATKRLWELLEPILMLDQKDPAAAWHRKREAAQALITRLNSLELNLLHFQAPGTDLKVGLTPRSRWVGGASFTPDNRPFQANIPTEEVFTTPDYRLTEGRVRVTKPLKVLETLVEGAWFIFEKGRVVEHGAQRNGHVLTEYLATDKGAAFLGEVALVDNSSPISRTGRLFHSILFDENASCHIALGSGYPSAMKEGRNLHSDEDQRKAGCNVSRVHTDFMIGSEELTLIGTAGDGMKHTLMDKGCFSLLALP